eukprot:m.42477 g.42477  ORF g.42477 m.42477 type:complete len:57 (+) comp12884_c0_seq3:57-227(+)
MRSNSSPTIPLCHCVPCHTRRVSDVTSLLLLDFRARLLTVWCTLTGANGSLALGLC